jgi:hypothetical protein
MKMTRYYRTVREARGALSLDVGFDPFTSGGWGRCTKAKLAEQGYVVDPYNVAEIERGHRCKTCQAEITKREYDGMQYYWPEYCPEHKKWNFQCDKGHRWQATDAEDKANDNKCPKCGGYWV